MKELTTGYLINSLELMPDNASATTPGVSPRNRVRSSSSRRVILRPPSALLESAAAGGETGATTPALRLPVEDGRNRRGRHVQ